MIKPFKWQRHLLGLSGVGVCRYWREGLLTFPLSLYIQGENVIRLQLDMPTRTTQSYEGPLVAPTVQAVLDKALESEQDIVVDAR